MFLFFLLACTSEKQVNPSEPDSTPSEPDAPVEDLSIYKDLLVQVQDTNGSPIAQALVSQPGTDREWITAGNGAVTIQLTRRVNGDFAVSAASTDHLIKGDAWYNWARIPESVTIELPEIPQDHDSYAFQDPGTPEHNDTTAQCAHCHITINEQWFESPHRTTASNIVVQDLYSGSALNIEHSLTCLDSGGLWQEGIDPATGEVREACYQPDGVLTFLNECSDLLDCQTSPQETGYCADCHAAGIEGEQGGRNLLDAAGLSYEYGVHCDVCHKVYDVDPTEELSGNAGKLEFRRPDDDGSNPVDLSLETIYGPLIDVLNPRMGSAYRPIFTEAKFCSGCHQLEQPIWDSTVTIDTARWPDGKLPVHSTYKELQQGALGEDVPCQSCHMSPNGYPGNTADLGNEMDLGNPDVGSGWYRSAGEVRKHRWDGPRTNIDFLRSAAILQLQKNVENGVLSVNVQTTNIGAGHAIPTGEPMRSLILSVQSFCDTEEQSVIGGDLVPDIGGYKEIRMADEGLDFWISAQVGDKIRVVNQTEEFYDYQGVDPFDQDWTPDQRGLVVEQLVGEVEVTVVGNAVIETDQPILEGDKAYLISDPTKELSGGAGFAFARIMVDSDGNRQAPHYRAVDIVSDNRLMPYQPWTSSHQFAVDCQDPVVHAQLIWRRYPLWLEREKHWENNDQVIAEVRR